MRRPGSAAAANSEIYKRVPIATPARSTSRDDDGGSLTLRLPSGLGLGIPPSSSSRHLLTHLHTSLPSPTPTMPRSYFISGASKGIGAEFVRQLLAAEPDALVIGAARTPDKSDELNELKEKYGARLRTVKLDVTNLKGVKEAAKEVEGIVGDAGLDVVSRWRAGLSVQGVG